MSVVPISFSSNKSGANPNGGIADLTPVSPFQPLPVANGQAPTQDLTAQSAINTQGAAVDNMVSRSNHTLFVVAGTGVSAGVITLLGSMDGINWVTTATAVTVTAAGAYSASLANTPYRYLAAKITTAIVGGTITAYIGSS